jgi:hypothetical protein
MKKDKKTRGRPEGTTGSHFVDVKLSELVSTLPGTSAIKVSRAWLKALEPLGYKLKTKKDDQKA